MSGCRTLHPAPRDPDNTRSYCAPPQVFTTDTLVAAGTAPTPRSPPDTTALPPLSARSWQLARAYDLEPALLQLAQRPPTGRGPATIAEYLAFVRQRQTVGLAVARAAAEALRVAGELECERQRADQSAVALQALTTKRTNHFTTASLVMGAASGTISATVANKETNLVLTVITAGLSAGLGVGALLVGPQLPYPVPRNLLAPVWSRSPRPALYPPGLWAVLNEVRAGHASSALPAPLARLRQRWAQYDQLAGGPPAQQAQQQALYFGAGGNYRVADLQTRARMLTLLETDVRLVAQDLQKLGEELNAVAP
ncbi:hypothetical protein [Hymenobacter sp. PAMC 26628]|uniref:hypothetical protein n=1 Tax=Hymenobacter sp. PAMC 26628 TaxID=1484118 RepID=UPI0007706BF7|nr:hypothetical protein [Hymenobacter sp. PAMC 26628]AMJ67481.1 hypothetical protein AXW84_20195 [Hymenobacter sp. PAMC 26628]